MREAELRSLDPEARLLLGALAVVAPASLSVEELGGITEVSESQLALAGLEERGLVVREGDRYVLAPEEQGPLKRLLASLDMLDRVLRGFIDIAEDGRLTLADLDAVLGLTRIAAETERWEELLRLAEAAETTLSTTRRVEAWEDLVEDRIEAGSPGDVEPPGVARLYRGGGGVRMTTAVLAVGAAAAVSLAAGYLVGNQSSEPSDGGSGKGAKTVTETETETEAAETVTETETETTTVFTRPTPTPRTTTPTPTVE